MAGFAMAQQRPFSPFGRDQKKHKAVYVSSISADALRRIAAITLRAPEVLVYYQNFQIGFFFAWTAGAGLATSRRSNGWLFLPHPGVWQVVFPLWYSASDTCPPHAVHTYSAAIKSTPPFRRSLPQKKENRPKGGHSFSRSVSARSIASPAFSHAC